MADVGINTVRVYTVPPRWLLDIALDEGLLVMVGLPWEQHVTFLDDADRAADIVRRVREGARTCAGHPALLAFAVGNEIPTPIVRWHGHRKVEAFLRRLYEGVKAEDPGALVTYVNYPSTEYLHLPFLDFTCFNVYLESREQLEAYLARLQNIAGDRPLVMAEVGLDSLRNGDERQGATLEWQIASVFAAGCAGVFVFAWTDEWHRGGHDIDDWKFGLTTVDRTPKPALDVVRRAYADTPFSMDRMWPRVSIVVCSHNGAGTIRETLEGLKRIEYPDYEVIVVDDGSTDDTVSIALQYPVRVLRSDGEIDLRTRDGAAGSAGRNMGLSVARNVGLAAAQAEIIAYLDDDAYPDEHWLMYLVDAFQQGKYAGVGGPNVSPAGDGVVAESVSRSPGNPTHVLVTDRVAEHIPGCNMAFRTDALRAIGGFDPRFTIAGDDVDVCWRIQERGGTLGFSAGAMVWHHRRNSVPRFWRQQYHYGAAEGQLQRKWPQRYTGGGRVAWVGRLYDPGAGQLHGNGRRRIFHGTWGSALFQSVYHQSASVLASLGLMPEWYVLIASLAVASLAGVWWAPLRGAIPLLVLAALVPLVQAIVAANRATFFESRSSGGRLLRVRALTAFFHVLQPLARLCGRLRHGGSRGGGGGRPKRAIAWPWPRLLSVWHETWAGGEARLEAVERRLRERRDVTVRRGGDYDRWDLEVRGGSLGGARVRMTIEEHGSGKQMARYRVWPRWASRARWAAGSLAAGAASAAAVGRTFAAVAAALAAVAVLAATWALVQCGVAIAAVRDAASETGKRA
jgi:GT2 family glycosyltransferase